MIDDSTYDATIRAIAFGDDVEIKDGELYINGELRPRKLGADVPELKAAKYRTERQEQTITAWKRVNLKVVRNKIAIAGARADYITHGSDARCINNDSIWCNTGGLVGSRPADNHVAPNPECSCGYYGVKVEHLEQMDQQYRELPHTAEIELSGTVIEHEKGYRAQHQRVMALYLGTCQWFLCNNEAEGGVWGQRNRETFYRVNCVDHLHDQEKRYSKKGGGGEIVAFTKSELAERLGTEVRGIPEHMR